MFRRFRSRKVKTLPETESDRFHKIAAERMQEMVENQRQSESTNAELARLLKSLTTWGAKRRNLRVKERIARIQERNVVGGRQLPDTLREARARELLVRKVILPDLKKAYGRFFQGLVLIGSSQRRLRKSKPTSDIDLWVVIDEGGFLKRKGVNTARLFNEMRLSDYNRWEKFAFWFSKRVAESIEKRFGIKCQIAPIRFEELAKTLVNESWNKEPFQVISGENSIMPELEKQFADSSNPKKALKENLRQRTHSDYKLRPKKYFAFG